MHQNAPGKRQRLVHVPVRGQDQEGALQQIGIVGIAFQRFKVIFGGRFAVAGVLRVAGGEGVAGNGGARFVSRQNLRRRGTSNGTGKGGNDQSGPQGGAFCHLIKACHICKAYSPDWKG